MIEDGAVRHRTVPMLTALNLDLRNEYADDCARGRQEVEQELEKAGVDVRLYLPHQGFNRKVGAFAGHLVTPDGTHRRRGRPGSVASTTGCPPPRTTPGSPS